MKIIDEVYSKKEVQAVWALGGFDAIHVGHQYLLSQAKELSEKLNVGLGIFTFLFSPKSILKESRKPFSESIFSSDYRQYLFEKLGVDYCVMIKPNKDFLSLSSQYFLKEILLENLRAKGIVVGQNFKFGKDRLGNTKTLQGFGCKNNIEITVVSLQEFDEKIISSSCIREYLKQGQFDLANKALGRTDFYGGKVVKGYQLGKTIGFPTANLEDIPAIKSGVYSVSVWGSFGKRNAIMNVGYSPTVNNKKSKRIEIHIFNFEDSDLYGKPLSFHIKKFIRNEKKFSSLDDLKSQISKDIKTAKIING